MNMLDVPKLGLDLLNRMARRVAESSETADEYEQAIACIDGLKALVDPRTELKRALTATSKSGSDYVRRERDVMHSLMETVQVREMM